MIKAVSPAQREGYPALLVEELPHRRVRCHTCLRRCVIPPGGRGWCHTRENRDGALYSLIYGRVASLSLNPIEKKPLFLEAVDALGPNQDVYRVDVKGFYH